MAVAPQNVADALDAYYDGNMNLDDLVAYVRGRNLGRPPQSSEAQMWGAEDHHVPGPDEWQTIANDHRVSPEEYSALSAAHNASLGIGGK